MELNNSPINKRFRLCLQTCIRSTLLKDNPLLYFFKDVIEKRNENSFENKHHALKNEAKILKQLKYTRMKCCVEIIDYIDNLPTIIMEYCEGGDLRKLIDNFGDNIPLSDRIEIICQVLEGLKTIHKAGIIHGDLKSLNICLANKYEKKRISSNIVKLGDFGLSDQNKIMGGTPGFMAPEIRTNGESFASDVLFYWKSYA